MKPTAEPGDSTSPVLEMILARVPGLPPEAHILPKLLAALHDEESATDQVVELLSFDPGLTVKLIQLCNSAALGGQIRVTDVGQAVNRLGINCVYQLVAALSGSSVLNSPAVLKVLDVDQLWEHSVMVALAAAMLAREQEEDDSAAFTAGLLHESGKILMAQAFGENYSRLLAEHIGFPNRLVSREREAFSFDYPKAGGRMLARGAFPAVIVASVTFQHRPGEAQTHSRAAAVLSVANTLATWTKNPAADPACAEPANTDAMKILGLVPEFLPCFCERIGKEFKLADALCHL